MSWVEAKRGIGIGVGGDILGGAGCVVREVEIVGE